MSLLTITDASVRLGGRAILDGADITVDQGRRIGLVGRNGAGKSTLLRAIIGDQPLDGGEIRLAARARIATVAQEAPSGDASLLETVLRGDPERLALLAEADTAEPHRLAEIHVAVSAGRAAAEAAGPSSHSGTSDTTDTYFASMMAKLVAGRSATKVIGHCQQVLAGIGYTTQHPFHRYMKRIVVLERILGDSSELSQAVGILLATRGEAPRLVNL